jgi:hypothetical protein
MNVSMLKSSLFLDASLAAKKYDEVPAELLIREPSSILGFKSAASQGIVMARYKDEIESETLTKITIE